MQSTRRFLATATLVAACSTASSAQAQSYAHTYARCVLSGTQEDLHTPVFTLGGVLEFYVTATIDTETQEILILEGGPWRSNVVSASADQVAALLSTVQGSASAYTAGRSGDHFGLMTIETEFHVEFPPLSAEDMLTILSFLQAPVDLAAPWTLPTTYTGTVFLPSYQGNLGEELQFPHAIALDAVTWSASLFSNLTSGPGYKHHIYEFRLPTSSHNGLVLQLHARCTGADDILPEEFLLPVLGAPPDSPPDAIDGGTESPTDAGSDGVDPADGGAVQPRDGGVSDPSVGDTDQPEDADRDRDDRNDRAGGRAPASQSSSCGLMANGASPVGILALALLAIRRRRRL